jgi:hypothetical protein
VLESWQPELRKKGDLPKVIASYLAQLVKDGTVKKTKQKGQRAALYSIPIKQ